MRRKKENLMSSRPKVVVIGAGSFFFGKPLIYNMVHSPILNGGTLALVDINPEVLVTMKTIAERAKEHAGVKLEILASTDRSEVMKDADFVVLSFSFRNAYYRELDTRFSRKYGVTMCSSDTIGPGGIFRALRELPEVLRIAEDVRRLAPNAWLINFVNPTSTLGIGLMRYAPDIRSFALCDGNHEPYVRIAYLKKLGIIRSDAEFTPEVESKFELKIAGVNHCTWVLQCRYDGRDLMPLLLEKAREAARLEYERPPAFKAKPRFIANYALALMELYGAYPTAPSHTKEYVPFFQGYGVSPVTPEPLICFDGYHRAEEMAAAWAETRRLATGETPISSFFESGRGDHATDIIESMWGRLGKKFYINSPNRGAVANLAGDAFLELRCELDLEHGPRPLPVGNMPRGLLGLTQQVLDTHELTAEAAVTHDRRTLLLALATDPIVNNISDAKNIMNELLEAEREHLPPEWF